MRDCQTRNGDARDGVGLEEAEGVAGPPREYRKDVLQRQDEALEERLVLELAEGVVREEELTQPLLQALEGRAFGRHGGPVDFRKGHGGAREGHGILKATRSCETLRHAQASHHACH